MQIRKFVNWCMLLLLPGLLLGCGEAPEEKVARQAVAIESGEECHLCGMIITNFPGPKGEAFQSEGDTVHKFCSTRDLFSFILQPENKRQIKEVYVHDMSKTPWQKPEDEYFIDARTAWYVIGSNQKGAMGKTLASFSEEKHAKVFSKNYGGEVYKFDDITVDIL